MQPEKQSCLRNCERAQWLHNEPGILHQPFPHVEPLVPFLPPFPLPRNDILNLSPHPHLLHRHSLPARRRQRRLQRLEHRRVVAQSLREPLQEKGGAVLGLLLADRHDRRIHFFYVLQELFDLVEPIIIDQLVEEHGAVDGEDFTTVGWDGEGSGRGDAEGVEVEAEAEGIGEGLEAAACLEEEGEVGPGAGDSNGRRVGEVGAVGDGLEEERPLEAVASVEVEDVDRGPVLDGLEDGLVGGEVGEAEERGELVEGDDAIGIVRGGGEEAEAEGESAGEVVGEAVRGVAGSGGCGGED